MPGGSLTSKPTWWNASGCSATSAFFVVLVYREPPRCCLRDSARRPHSLSIRVEEEECLMRVFMTSFAALLALVTFGPGVMDTALGGDTGTNAKTNGGPAGVAGSPAIPPVPMADSAPTLRASTSAGPRSDINSSTCQAPRCDIRSNTCPGPRSDIRFRIRTQSYTGWTGSGRSGQSRYDPDAPRGCKRRGCGQSER